MDERKVKMAQSLMKDPNLSIQENCETLQVSKATLYRYLGHRKPSNEGIRLPGLEKKVGLGSLWPTKIVI